MRPVVSYSSSLQRSHSRPDAREIWAVACQLRRALAGELSGPGISVLELQTFFTELDVNGRRIGVSWDFEHAVHDDDGAPVFGVCETDGDGGDMAFVSVNGPLLDGRADLVLSTAAHELGHVVFDVAEALSAPQRSGSCYRLYTAPTKKPARQESFSEWRANEFMGALLAPPFSLHRQLLQHAREEGLTLVRGQSAGRPAWPVVSAHNDPETLEGVFTALAEDFGVSPRFIEVRLNAYGLLGAGNRGVAS
jgi:hypothetical protein